MPSQQGQEQKIKSLNAAQYAATLGCDKYEETFS